MTAATTIKPPLSDEAREAFIDDLGHLMQAAMKRAEASHSPKDKEEARRLLTLQNQAIKDRSPEQVARMELERGLNEGVNYFNSAALNHPGAPSMRTKPEARANVG
jgi:hypothetical protein